MHLDEEPACPARTMPGASSAAHVWIFCRLEGPRKKRTPAAIAFAPGATLEVPIDTRLADFSSAVTRRSSSTSVAKAVAPLDSPAATRMTLQYLVAPQSMGVVTLQCLGGCRCQTHRLDASAAGNSSGFRSFEFGVVGAAASCLLRLRVANTTSQAAPY